MGSEWSDRQHIIMRNPAAFHFSPPKRKQKHTVKNKTEPKTTNLWRQANRELLGLPSISKRTDKKIEKKGKRPVRPPPHSRLHPVQDSTINEICNDAKRFERPRRVCEMYGARCLHCVPSKRSFKQQSLFFLVYKSNLCYLLRTVCISAPIPSPPPLLSLKIINFASLPMHCHCTVTDQPRPGFPGEARHLIATITHFTTSLKKRKKNASQENSYAYYTSPPPSLTHKRWHYLIQLSLVIAIIEGD